MTLLPILLALAPWPAPCAEPNTCWLAWHYRIEKFEVWSGDDLCAELRGFRKRNGRWVNPIMSYWPRPRDGPHNAPGSQCWKAGQSSTYRIRACTDGVCGPFDEPVEFGPQEFWCFDARGEIPCEGNP